MLIGIFGGTFDPVHLGHRKAVDQLNEHLQFDQVHWVLSARPPHKDAVSADIEHRFKMLELALADEPRYIPDRTEVERSTKSYTIDTVEAFHQRFPQAKLVVIIGGDSVHNLPTWHRYHDLMNSVNWVVMNRPGYLLKVPSELKARLVESPAQLLQHANGKIWLYTESEHRVSSTQIRKNLVNDAHSTELVREPNLQAQVYDYICRQQLYKLPKRSSSETIQKVAMNSEQIKDLVVDAIEGVKGQDIKAIDIADISDFADYMIVVSGTSDTHVKALARTASDELRRQGVKPLNEDGADVGEWVLVDFGDVVLHVMRPEVRDYYDLERLWDEDVRKMVEQHREDRDD